MPDCGGRVAAVHEAVEAYLAQTVAARELEQREHMVNVGVNAAVGQEAEDVQGGIEPLALVDGAPSEPGSRRKSPS